jgi:hypothetical protein
LQNVFGCVDISVMVLVAIGASPCSQLQLFHFSDSMTTTRTKLAGGKRSSYFYQFSSVFFRFVFQHRNKLRPHVIQLIKRQVTLEWPKQVEINAFLEGYGLEENSFPHWESNLEPLLLLDAFDKLRWAIDCQPDRIPFFVNYAKQLKKRI